MLQTKCILTQPQTKDGVRVSIMSRHTLSDGITLDTRIADDLYDIHCPLLAPPPKLVGAFYQKKIIFDNYTYLYKTYLQKNHALLIRHITQYAIHNDITFLCIESNPDFCHRKIFIQECIKIIPSINYSIQ